MRLSSPEQDGVCWMRSRWIALVVAAALGVSALHAGQLPPQYWETGVADLRVSGSTFKPGDYVTANVSLYNSYWCNNMEVGCPYAETEVILNGQKVNGRQAGGWGMGPFFDFNPRPYSSGSMCFVHIPNYGEQTSSTLTFRIKPNANATFTSTTTDGVTRWTGPFVVLHNSSWAEYVGIQIVGADTRLQATLGLPSDKLYVNGTFAITVKARNNSSENMTVVAPRLWTADTSKGSIGAIGKPDPESKDLAAGAEQAFTYQVMGATSGTVDVVAACEGKMPSGDAIVSENATGQLTLRDAGELTCTIAAWPEKLAVGDVIRVDLTATNSGTVDLTGVAPTGALQTDGLPQLELTSGPEPASNPKLEPGQKEIFVYNYKVKSPGCVTFKGQAQGSYPTNQTATSELVTSNLVKVRPTLKVAKLVCTEPDDQITPCDKLEIKVTIDKLCEGHVENLKASVSSGALILGGTEPVTATGVPDGVASFEFSVPAHVANELNDQIKSDLLDAAEGEKPISLQDVMVVDLSWTEDGEANTDTQLASLTKTTGAVWEVTYPDCSKVTGEPPTDTDQASEEALYYRQGFNQISRKGNGAYLRDALVRKWALILARYQDPDDAMPDDPGKIADNIAQYLGTNIPFNWTSGYQLSFAEELAGYLEAGQSIPAHACIGKALAYGTFVRVLGLRARELDHARKMDKIYGPAWDQHAANQVWYGGQWQFYDITYVFANGGKPVRNYPDFYWTIGWAGLMPYKYIRTWHAYRINMPVGDGFELFGQEKGNETSVGEIKRPEYWKLYAEYARPSGSQTGKSDLHLEAHSPVTMLYVDAQGRRVGATGPIDAADYVSIDGAYPPPGGHTVSEVPGAIYIAPGTPIPLNGSAVEAMDYAREQIIIPGDEVTETFSLEVTGTSTGDYEIKGYLDKDAGPVQVYSRSGSIGRGETQQVMLQAKLEGDSPSVLETAANEPGTEPSGSCGACGSGAIATLPFAIAGLALIKRRSRRSS